MTVTAFGLLIISVASDTLLEMEQRLRLNIYVEYLLLHIKIIPKVWNLKPQTFIIPPNFKESESQEQLS